MSDNEYIMTNKFPEVLAIDATAATNNEKRELIQVAGKDSNNTVFYSLRAFLPSEKRWVYHWLFSERFPLLLGDDVVCNIKVIFTDGDSDAYTSLCCLIDEATTPWHGCYHGLRAWHLFDNSWLKHITPSVPKIRNITTIEYLEVAKKKD
jgi:hypothetical protein